MDIISDFLKDDAAKIIPIFHELLVLLVEFQRQRGVGNNELSHLISQRLSYYPLLLFGGLLLGNKGAILLEGFVVHAHKANLHVLNVLASHAIFSIQELNDLLLTGPNSTIILDHHIFKGLDESALDVTSLGSLNGGINETFTATHSVEEELRGGQAAQIAVLYETS